LLTFVKFVLNTFVINSNNLYNKKLVVERNVEMFNLMFNFFNLNCPGKKEFKLY